MKVLDNFLHEEDFKPIQSYFLNKLPWTYLNYIVGTTGVEEEDEDCYQFVHTFFSAKDPYLERKTSEHSHINLLLGLYCVLKVTYDLLHLNMFTVPFTPI